MRETRPVMNLRSFDSRKLTPMVSIATCLSLQLSGIPYIASDFVGLPEKPVTPVAQSGDN